MTKSFVRRSCCAQDPGVSLLSTDNIAETNRPGGSLHARTCMGRVPVGAALGSASFPARQAGDDTKHFSDGCLTRGTSEGLATDRLLQAAAHFPSEVSERLVSYWPWVQ